MCKQNICFLGDNIYCLGSCICLFILKKISPSNLMTCNIVPKRRYVIIPLFLPILCNYSFAVISILPHVFLNPHEYKVKQQTW